MGGLDTVAGSRAAKLATLEGCTWDLVVIGGGITGAGVAQQAARRGWRVLLVEQRDFAWGTSNRYVWDATRATIPGRGPVPVAWWGRFCSQSTAWSGVFNNKLG